MGQMFKNLVEPTQHGPGQNVAFAWSFSNPHHCEPHPIHPPPAPRGPGCESRYRQLRALRLQGCLTLGLYEVTIPLDPDLLISKVIGLEPIMAQRYNCMNINYDENGIERLILKGVTFLAGVFNS